MLLDNGYRLVDDGATKGSSGDRYAVAYISQNADNLFTVTVPERCGQSPDSIIDARNQPSMSPDIAQRGVNRAYSADSKSGVKIKSITLITSQRSVYVPRLPQ